MTRAKFAIPSKGCFISASFRSPCGYENLNDADDLRHDSAVRSAVGRLSESDPDLASQPALSRLENSIDHAELHPPSEVPIEAFVAGRDQASQQVIIDVENEDRRIVDVTRDQYVIKRSDVKWADGVYEPRERRLRGQLIALVRFVLAMI